MLNKGTSGFMSNLYLRFDGFIWSLHYYIHNFKEKTGNYWVLLVQNYANGEMTIFGSMNLSTHSK